MGLLELNLLADDRKRIGNYRSIIWSVNHQGNTENGVTLLGYPDYLLSISISQMG